MNFSINKISNPDFVLENCKVYHYINEEIFKINVFFLEADFATISKYWQKFSNMIAIHYQNPEYMSNKEFERWNFYIIYISKDIVSKELKNKIENDKFSSRKIVEDSHSKDLNSHEANSLIVKYITNSDLIEIVRSTPEVNNSEYVPKNKNLWSLLEREEKVIGDRNAQKDFIKNINSL